MARPDPKHSKEIPRLTKLQETLTRRKDYEGARKVQREIEALSVDRTDEWVAEKNTKVARQLELVKKRQEVELQNFNKKATTVLNELKRAEAKEEEAKTKHYRNCRQEMLNVHKHENTIAGTRKEVADPKSLKLLSSDRKAIMNRYKAST